MSKKGLIKEHKELVKVLKSGSKSDRMQEAKEQGSELKKWVKSTCKCNCNSCNKTKKMNKKCNCTCDNCKGKS